jgi:hypothetical protein
MIAHDVEQGSLEWMQVRLGIPTASQFDRIVTPKKMAPATAADGYRAELLAEYLLGQPLEWGTSGWMERGTDMEDEARRWYAFERDVDVEKVGFVTSACGRAGGSPDGLVGDDGGIEIKCLSAKNHVRHMLGESIATHHVGQVQGYLWLTGRKWWDVISYHPDLPSVVERVTPNAEWVNAFEPALEAFSKKLESEKERLSQHRVLRPWHPEVQALLRGQR